MNQWILCNLMYFRFNIIMRNWSEFPKYGKLYYIVLFRFNLVRKSIYKLLKLLKINMYVYTFINHNMKYIIQPSLNFSSLKMSTVRTGCMRFFFFYRIEIYWTSQPISKKVYSKFFQMDSLLGNIYLYI